MVTYKCANTGKTGFSYKAQSSRSQNFMSMDDTAKRGG